MNQATGSFLIYNSGDHEPVDWARSVPRCLAGFDALGST